MKSLEFEARTEREVTTGGMAYVDQANIPDVDDSEDPRAGDAPPELYVKADFDTMVVEKNRALMGGKVIDSTHKTFIGQWVQLVVEDNGRDPRVPDQLTWAFCQPQNRTWVPSDADWKDDDGAYLSWWATDAERKDDVGIPSVNLLAEEKSCPVFSLALYSFAEIQKPEGDIVVEP
ncbi:MAG TPA: hypothetical protein VMW27_06780 [Thermoanaerobaculia bacterium]|nr:hypothetical protein [Thermoanaerobaculia bacterium]